MKFLLSRTSVWDYRYEDKTDDEVLGLIKVDAKKYKLSVEKFDRIDHYGFRTFEEYDKIHNKKFISEGTDHKVVKYGIQRTFKNDKTGVFIEIDSLDDLLELEKDYEDIIIKQNYCNKDIIEIEIYDDYRE